MTLRQSHPIGVEDADTVERETYPWASHEWLRYDGETLCDAADIVVLDSHTDGQYNAELDGWIGQQVAHGGRPATIRLWRSGYANGLSVSRRDVSTPQGQQALGLMREKGLDVVVRQTGGTAVPQGPGVLHCSWILPRSRRKVTTDAYFRLLCTPILAWLRHLGIVNATVGALEHSYCDGNYNILVNGRKLIGTAQAWRGGLAGIKGQHPGYVLAHACITVDVPFKQSLPWLNEFYRLAGDSYRVDESTAVNLRDLLRGSAENRILEGPIVSAASSLQANRAALFSLHHFLSQWLPEYGIRVRG